MSHFTSDFFTGNRQTLLKKLSYGSLVIVAGNGLMQRANDLAYKFHQESNFWYLSGVDFPDWWMIIDGASGRSWLVHPDVDEIRDVFDGTLSAEKAIKISGVDAVIDRTEARQLFGKLRSKHTVAYTVLPQKELHRYGFYPNPANKDLIEELRSFQVQDCRNELAKMRAIKQSLEIQAIQKAIDITGTGLKQVFSNIKKLKSENEIEALLSFHFTKSGAMSHAYDPIVASDINACTLHYDHNNASISSRSWVLMDVGARFDHYCADITRTVSVSNTPSQRKRAIHESVRTIQKKSIELCVAGQAVKEYQTKTTEFVAEELLKLKLIQDVNDIDKVHAYMPHMISHGLGIDVHDSLGNPTYFEAGMVLTVEPGIYIPDEHIGVRIEDNILITDDKPKNLSKNIPASPVVA